MEHTENHEDVLSQQEFRAQPIDLAETVDPKKAAKEKTITALSEIKDSLTRITSVEDIEEVTYRVMDTLPESLELQARITIARQHGDGRQIEELVRRQKNIYEDISGELALIAGIETDTARVERENAEYRLHMLDLVSDADIDDVTSGNILISLGMLVKDEGTAEPHFTYPHGVFPPHIDEKWDHYIEVVAQHVRAITVRQDGVANDTGMIAQLDVVRTAAHNNLSLVIKEFLKLDNWDLDKCRNLVIKMRDAKFPTIETAEKEVTATEVARLIATIKNLSKK